MIMGSSVWTLIYQSDAATWVILGVLLIMSIVSWAIALYKMFTLRSKDVELAEALQRVAAATTKEQLYEIGRTRHALASGYLIGRAAYAARAFSGRPLSADDLALLRDELGSGIGELMAQEDTYVPFLRTTAEVGTLLGLLGTIWGLIHSFLRISQEQSADIVTVAPGIAEALITTLIGLLVTIPALIFFHAISRKLSLFEQRLATLAAACERIIRMS